MLSKKKNIIIFNFPNKFCILILLALFKYSFKYKILP